MTSKHFILEFSPCDVGGSTLYEGKSEVMKSTSFNHTTYTVQKTTRVHWKMPRTTVKACETEWLWSKEKDTEVKIDHDNGHVVQKRYQATETATV